MNRFLGIALVLASVPALAQVQVKEPWVRATVAHQTASGAFLQITSARDAKLVEVRTPVAGVAEVHEMKMDQGVMRMSHMPGGLELPAGRTVELKPSGYHVMLMGLKRQLKAGESVPLTLVVEARDGKRETVQVTAAVRPLNAGSVEHQGH